MVVVGAAAVGPSYREAVREKTKPDCCRHPMGRNLTLKKARRESNVERHEFGLFFPTHFLVLTFPKIPLISASQPPLLSKASGPRMGCSLVWQSCSEDVMECRQQQEDNRLSWSVVSLQGRLHSVRT